MEVRGHVFLWTLAHEALGDGRYSELAERAAWDVWEAPMVGSSRRCCGAGGKSVRASEPLLILTRSSGAALLANASAAAESLAGDASGAWCLYKGHAGLALLAAELDEPGSVRHPAVRAGALIRVRRGQPGGAAVERRRASWLS
jgi:serine/threonine-protein kinase